MDAIYLLVENSIVINAILWDGSTETWQPPGGVTAIALPEGSDAWIGWSYDGTNFVAPVETADDQAPTS